LIEEKTYTFDVCPVCKGNNRLAGGVGEQMKKLGKIKPEETVFVNAHQSLLVPPSPLMVFTAPVLITYYDVCADCGAYYCVKAELKEVTVRPQPQGTHIGRPLAGV